MADWVLAELTHASVRQNRWQVAVLPFGATEPHNLHLPYGTDTYQVEEIGRRACEWAHRRGARVLLLPTIPFGVNTNHLRIPGGLALSITPITLIQLVTDLVESLETQGLRKLVLLNGHGGNELKPVIRQLHHRSKVFLAVCDWYRVAQDRYGELFQEPGEHADEVETSLGLAFFADLVHQDQAGSGAARPSILEGVRRGWVSITRPWHVVTEDTGIGDPRAATADKGRRLMDILTERIGSFLVELAQAPLTDHFPY